MKHGKKPDEMHEQTWVKFKKLREDFYNALKDEDEAKINEILDAHPDNQIEYEEDGEKKSKTYIQWKDCPLWITAAYYANDRLEIDKMPVPEPDEIKQQLTKQ